MAPELRLRPAVLADAELLLAWRNDAQTRAASHHSEPIALDAHLQWLRRSLATPERTLLIAMLGEEPAGTVRIDREGAVSHLSWTVAPAMRGRGLGRRMVALAVQGIAGPLRAEVRAGNTASMRIAEAAGMRPVRQDGAVLYYERP